MTGDAIAASAEAPLGPTCIYKATGSQPGVTLAVGPVASSQAARSLPHRKPVVVGDRRGYCGRLGTEQLIVPLAHGQILNVTAPCGIAQRFAAEALSHLAA
jgi:hypothetical protein